MPAVAHRHAPAHEIRRRAGHRPRRCPGPHRALHQRRPGQIHRAAGQCRRNPARTGAPRRASRCRHRPDLRARSAARLPAGRLDAGRMVQRAEEQPAEGHRRGQTFHAHACGGDAELRGHGRAHLRLRQQHPADGLRRGLQGRLRLPGFRAGLRAAAVLPRHRPLPLGRAQRRPRGHLQDRREGKGTDPGQSAPAPLAGHGARAHQLPGPAGAHLLGWPGRPPSPGAGLQ